MDLAKGYFRFVEILKSKGAFAFWMYVSFREYFSPRDRLFS